MTTPNAQLIAELEHVAFCDYTLQKDLLDRAIAALSQPAIPKTLGDTVALIVRDVCELEYPAHPDKPMLLTVSVNELSEILMDRLSQDAAIQQEPDSDSIFDDGSPPTPYERLQVATFFTLETGGPNPYYKCNECGKSIPGLKGHLLKHIATHAHPQPATQPATDKAELTDAQMGEAWDKATEKYRGICTHWRILFNEGGRAIIAADRALRNGEQQ